MDAETDNDKGACATSQDNGAFRTRLPYPSAAHLNAVGRNMKSSCYLRAAHETQSASCSDTDAKSAHCVTAMLQETLLVDLKPVEILLQHSVCSQAQQQVTAMVLNFAVREARPHLPTSHTPTMASSTSTILATVKPNSPTLGESVSQPLAPNADRLWHGHVLWSYRYFKGAWCVHGFSTHLDASDLHQWNNE